MEKAQAKKKFKTFILKQSNNNETLKKNLAKRSHLDNNI